MLYIVTMYLYTDKLTDGAESGTSVDTQSQGEMDVTPPEGATEQASTTSTDQQKSTDHELQSTNQEDVDNQETADNTMDVTASESPTDSEAVPRTDQQQSTVPDSTNKEDAHSQEMTMDVTPSEEGPIDTVPSTDQQSTAMQSSAQEETTKDSMKAQTGTESNAETIPADSSVDKIQDESSVDRQESMAEEEEEVKRKEEDEDNATFPTTLEEFGYHFKGICIYHDVYIHIKGKSLAIIKLCLRIPYVLHAKQHVLCTEVHYYCEIKFSSGEL